MLSRRRYRQALLKETMKKCGKDDKRLVNLFLQNETDEEKICLQYKNTIYNNISFLINHTDIITYRNLNGSYYNGYNKLSIAHCNIISYEKSYFLPFNLKFQMTPRKIRMSHGIYNSLYDELEMELAENTGFFTPTIRDTMIASIYEFIREIKKKSYNLFEDETINLDNNVVNNNTLITNDTYTKCIELYREKRELLSYTLDKCKCQTFKTANLHFCVCNLQIPVKFW